MVWPAIIAAGATLASAAISHTANRSHQDNQIQASFDAQRQQQVYNKMNYMNRYQWTAHDMKRAGLNPILAAKGGFNVGAGPNVGLPSMGGATTQVGDFSASAKNVAQANTEKDKQNLLMEQANHELEKIEKTRREQGLVSRQEAVALQQYHSLKEEMLLNITKEGKVEMEEKLLEQNIISMKAQLVRLQEMSEVYDGPAGAIISYLNALLGTFNVGINK